MNLREQKITVMLHLTIQLNTSFNFRKLVVLESYES